MMSIGRNLPIILGLAVAIILQMILGSVMSIGNAMPNFVLSYVIALAFANKGYTNILIAFFGGFIFDLLGYGPMGAMSFVCVLMMFACSALNRTIDSGGLAMTLVMIAASCLVGEFIYGLLLMACGVDVGLLDALAFRILPCSLYDIVIAIIGYFLVLRFVVRERDASEMTIIDKGMD